MSTWSIPQRSGMWETSRARVSVAALLELQPNLRGQFKGDQKDFQGPQVYVPHELRMKGGGVKKWQLSIRCDNPEHRWYFDGTVTADRTEKFFVRFRRRRTYNR